MYVFVLSFRVTLQYLVRLGNTQLSRFGDIKASLARILHKYLYQTSVIISLGKVRVEFNCPRVVVIRLGQCPRYGVQICSVVVSKGKFGVEFYRLVQVGNRLVVVVSTSCAVV